MKPTLLSILATLAVVVSACGPSGQPAAGGGGTGANNVTVSTPGAPAATPAAAATPAVGATQAAPKPAATSAQPTPAAQSQSNVQPSGDQSVTVNALQGEPDNLDPNRRFSLLIQDLPVAPMYYRGRMVLVKPWVRGGGDNNSLVITPIDAYPGVTFLRQVFVTR
jgi:hypothetical protein